MKISFKPCHSDPLLWSLLPSKQNWQASMIKGKGTASVTHKGLHVPQSQHIEQQSLQWQQQ
jgi:hypothetical protein